MSILLLNRLVIVVIALLISCSFMLVNSGYLGIIPPGCDEEAALKCEYDFLLCKLFNGPANDPVTLCNCANDFYGACLRLAGVSRTITDRIMLFCSLLFLLPVLILVLVTICNYLNY